MQYTLLRCRLPDDIVNKIIILLLGLEGTSTAECIKRSFNEINASRFKCGRQYEIRAQYNMVQKTVMCHIRIAQFDAHKGKQHGVKNIKNYIAFLREQFKRRHLLLFC